MAGIDPYSAAFMALGSAAQAAPAGPSSAAATNAANSGFDSSGWNVNFGSGTASSSSTKQDAATSALSSYLPWIVLGVGGVLLWRTMRKR